jgi:hypothetical protein
LTAKRTLTRILKAIGFGIPDDKKQHTTWVLPLVGPDIVTIGSGNSAVLQFGAGRIKLNFRSQYLTLSKSQAAVPGGRNSDSPPAAIPGRWLLCRKTSYILFYEN